MARAPLAFPPRALAPLLALAAVCALLAGCAFNPGGDQLAWQRGDQLWVANPDGSGARDIAPGFTSGYAWSPDHHELVFRFGKSASPPPAGATWAAPETPSDLAVVSISGGQSTQITPDGAGLFRSDAWWDPQGNRLLYREYGAGAPLAAVYFDSQNDQPVGIARKVILDSADLPTLAPDGQRVAVIDPNGNVLIGAPSQTGKIIARGAALTLPGSDRPARLLWRPGHDALVYPAAGDQPNTTTLRLLDLASGRATTLTTISGLLDASFSPDGASLLLHTNDGLLLWSLARGAPETAITDSDPLLQAWWSPDSRWLLMADSAGLRLYSAASAWRVQASLTLAMPLTEPATGGISAWRPATANPWRADGSAFVFASGPAQWAGGSAATLDPSPAGVYVERLSASGPSGGPALIASGDVSAPSWGYSDPSTVLLLPAAD
ncbi:MAG TPA: hypothetical protein VF808_16365 [Ktedonobacterales bacterium]